MTMPQLPFNRDQALLLANYAGVPLKVAERDRAADARIAPYVTAACAAGYMTYEGFVAVCQWKSPRPIHWYRMNTAATIATATHCAFVPHAQEGERIDALDGLIGVGYPVASAILHWCYPAGCYPIIDYHALGTLGWLVPATYTLTYWLQYVDACRAIADAWSMDMRSVDRALYWHDWLATTGKGTRCRSTTVAASREGL